MKDRFPVKLKTVKAEKNALYKMILSDIELLNKYYSIFPEDFSESLCQDLNLLFNNEIASKFRLAFYDPLDPGKIFLEKSYQLNSGKINIENLEDIEKHNIPTPYEFDVFVYFTDRFLSLSKAEQESIINGFNFKWFDFTTAFYKKSGNARDSNNEDVHLTASHNNRADHKSKTGLDSTRNGAPDNADTGLQQKAEKSLKSSHSSIIKHFSSGNFLFIASYTDSRKLIEKFVAMSGDLGLTPVQWTYSEGFKAVTDKYLGRYTYGDNYFMQTKLSPLDALGCIKNECQRNTIYLLEDFHYYLKRENLSAQEFAELISMIKSMPEILKSLNSFMVILAPSPDLPPEIAPIFEIIRDEVAGQRFHYLERFGRDLTKLVLEGKIKPIIGRDREIFECLKVLSRMETNNPILIGKAGVGKTAVVEGLARVIIKKEVPAVFEHKRIIALNLNAIISGTKYRGEFEKRIEGLVEEVKSNTERVIVFIDEIHTLLGMGSTEGSPGAENILKPSLARGEFPCIGATTYEDYRKYIEPDKALARRFQTINIPEPDLSQSIKILKDIKHVYENHHGLKISEEALVKCVEMSNRFIPEQCFPGKAIRMLDSACASASLDFKDIVTPELVADEFNKL